MINAESRFLRRTFADSLLILYGALTLFRIWISFGFAKAHPTRIPANPNPLEKVCSTTRRS